uniref:Chromo domain-containing protein n=1 Tax=Panagrolaimus sp. ES5 TaxID=591445 RepID=A0AC34FS51_9BILA
MSERVRQPTQRQSSTDSDDSNEHFEVQKILRKRVTGGNVEYYVKWKNYSSSFNSWEPAENCDCPDLIKKFEGKKKKAKTSKKRCRKSKKSKSSDSSGSRSRRSRPNPSLSSHHDPLTAVTTPELLPNDGIINSTVTLQQQPEESIETSSTLGQSDPIVAPGPSVRANRRVRFRSPLIQTFKYEST